MERCLPNGDCKTVGVRDSPFRYVSQSECRIIVSPVAPDHGGGLRVVEDFDVETECNGLS